jgi:hypothetical protein
MALHLVPASSIALLAAPGGARVRSVASPPASWFRAAAASSSSTRRRRRRLGVALAMAGGENEEEEPTASAAAAAAGGRMNLNEYMVAVDRPLGLRFALAVDGRVFVHSLKRGVKLHLSSAARCA